MQKQNFHRDYSTFNLDISKEDLENIFKNNFITKYSNFKMLFLEIFHKHALIKEKLLSLNGTLSECSAN